jgi:aminoglycoside/choline kinase family phosphotransferase
MVAEAIPVTFEALTPTWLTETLRAGGTIGDAAVTDVQWTPIGQGVGVLCQLARLSLTYDRPAPGAPATMVAKLPSPSEQTRAMAHAFQFYAREVAFYRELAPDVGLTSPRAYHAVSDPATQDFTLLLEDIGDRRLGDQVVGCTAEEAALAVAELPRLHAPWWNNPRLKEVGWLPTAGSAVNKAGMSFFPQAWPLFQAQGHTIPPRLQAVGERMAVACMQILDRFESGPCTICHGDYRSDNFFFGGAGQPPLTVVDWQISLQASGVYDVAYFLSQSVSPEVRRAVERDLLQRYHEALLAGGVRDYSFDQMLADYRWGLLFCFNYPVMGGGLGDVSNERGVALVEAMWQRSSTAILDWDADALLQEL